MYMLIKHNAVDPKAAFDKETAQIHNLANDLAEEDTRRHLPLPH